MRWIRFPIGYEFEIRIRLQDMFNDFGARVLSIRFSLFDKIFILVMSFSCIENIEITFARQTAKQIEPLLVGYNNHNLCLQHTHSIIASLQPLNLQQVYNFALHWIARKIRPSRNVREFPEERHCGVWSHLQALADVRTKDPNTTWCSHAQSLDTPTSLPQYSTNIDINHASAHYCSQMPDAGAKEG